jgi:hypothetical protein
MTENLNRKRKYSIQLLKQNFQSEPQFSLVENGKLMAVWGKQLMTRTGRHIC